MSTPPRTFPTRVAEIILHHWPHERDGLVCERIFRETGLRYHLQTIIGFAKRHRLVRSAAYLQGLRQSQNERHEARLAKRDAKAALADRPFDALPDWPSPVKFEDDARAAMPERRYRIPSHIAGYVPSASSAQSCVDTGEVR